MIRTDRPRTAFHPLSLAVACALLALALPVLAQTQTTETAEPAAETAPAPRRQLQAVTVTAERRAANIQKTAIAMQAVGGAEIAQQGLSSGSEILKNVPNVEVKGSARGNVIALRGIGSDLPPGMGESAISTNCDGIYKFRAEMNTLGFFDLERVEVMRGLQGTLYGRNAAAGALNDVTRDPVPGKRQGNASLELGTQNLMRTEAGFSFIPQANWDNSSTCLQAMVHPTTPGLEKVGYQDYEGTHLWAQLDMNLGFANLTVLPGWQDASGVVYRKYDGSRPPDSLEQYNADPSVARQKSMEVRLASPTGSPFQWVAGAYWYDMLNAQECLLGTTACASANNTRDTTTSKALFGQVSVPIAEGTRLVTGLRLTRDHKTAIDGSVGDWDSTDGKIGLEHDLRAKAMTYLNWSTAYRPGGFSTLPGASGTFDAEQLRSLELGLKSRWLDDTVQLNAAVFRYDYRNDQAVDFTILDSGDLHAKFLNVPKQTIQGVEAEAQALLPGQASKVRASFTWLDAKLGDLIQTNSAGSTYSLVWWIETLDGHIWLEGAASIRLPRRPA